MIRKRYDDGIKPYMLDIDGLHGLCSDYLEYCNEMRAGHDRATIHHLDAQRQVTHESLMQALGITRDDGVDMYQFCLKYTGRS